ncbi:hypothetical protein NDU88_006686 [Pleurodeles waltl]|uniref:Uncharacterized protein n=1 Tax=Pleurodeles waltl TaxID=8319 RepID=A0AAV7NU67_PLEWA|nr:hypothetical protein NDU88_006686 [Pleurodeles waltl]
MAASREWDAWCTAGTDQCGPGGKTIEGKSPERQREVERLLGSAEECDPRDEPRTPCDEKRGKIPLTHRRFLQSSWCREEAGYPQSMHHLETVEKAVRMKRYRVASSRLATLLQFCRRPEQSAVDSLAEGEERDAEELG